jgi:hypothetical protein
LFGDLRLGESSNGVSWRTHDGSSAVGLSPFGIHNVWTALVKSVPSSSNGLGNEIVGSGHPAEGFFRGAAAPTRASGIGSDKDTSSSLSFPVCAEWALKMAGFSSDSDSPPLAPVIVGEEPRRASIAENRRNWRTRERHVRIQATESRGSYHCISSVTIILSLSERLEFIRSPGHRQIWLKVI